jgi:hypothetical protein
MQAIDVLYGLTAAGNFLCLVVSLWLGFYIVTRSPHSRVSWLASATLWSLSGYFLNHLTHVQGPPAAGPMPWWWGWSVAFAAPFWYHLTVVLLPDPLARSRRWTVVLAYLLTLNLLAMEAYTPWVFAGVTGKLPIYNSSQRPGLLYPLFALYLVGVPLLSLYNLRLGRSQARSPLIRGQFTSLMWAASLAAWSGIYTAVSVWFGLDTPTLLGSLSLGAGVALLGYGVARYNALIEGRAIRADFIYTSLAMAVVVAAYMGVAFISDWIFGVPFVAFVLVIILAIASHSLYDWARTLWDRLFHRRHYRELRANLRQFVLRAAGDQDIHESLEAVLGTLCRSLDVDRGLIALRRGEEFAVVAARPAGLTGQSIPVEGLETEDITVLSVPPVASVLEGTAMWVPLHVGGEPIGALALGSRAGGLPYGEEELDLLEDCADSVAGFVHVARLQQQSVRQIDALLKQVGRQELELQQRMRQALAAESKPLHLAGRNEGEAVSLVEDALRHMHDYTYLGEHPLARLRAVDSFLAAPKHGFVTHLDRGKALQELLVAAIDKLRPSGPAPSPPGREWYAYRILHDCYVVGRLNRDVMAVLYVSEGTFNRARRRAVRAVTRAVAEIERQTQREVDA